MGNAEYMGSHTKKLVQPRDHNAGQRATSARKKPFIISLCANSEGTPTVSLRNFPAPARGLQHGEASPGEFPWTCLVLNQNNDFIGSCAVIPNDSSNNNGRGTRKVVTAAHKLK